MKVIVGGDVRHHPEGGVGYILSRQDQRIFEYYPTEGPSYPDQEEEIANRSMLSNSELYKLLTEKEEVPDHLSNIPHNAMSDFFRMLHLIVAYNIDPRRRTSEASFKRAKLMVYIVRGSQ
ncbi:hypothetical protein CJ030_MR7G017865 [Morella rubra]|uniref:Uncharacterized protein n=1 Tax=Morella rubra TaxID=262757 RepID=A0A6A1UZA0_9ROSI|nr:hypothetical protein CJ030_MR7G017865 [Morella rubra]